MKKFILALLLAFPTISSCQIVEPFFMEDQFEEFAPDPVSGIYHFCKYKKIEYETLMKGTKKTQIYLVYRSKRDAYLEMLEYIKEN